MKSEQLKTYLRKVRPRFAFYALIVLVVGIVLWRIELDSSQPYAPESVLVQVLDKGAIQEDAQCYGDIFVDQEQTQKKKPLRALASLYDFLDSASFYASTDRGFYVLETGFAAYRGDFEIRIVCYTKDFKGVSYTIVDNKNRHACEIRENGKIVVC